MSRAKRALLILVVLITTTSASARDGVQGEIFRCQVLGSQFRASISIQPTGEAVLQRALTGVRSKELRPCHLALLFFENNQKGILPSIELSFREKGCLNDAKASDPLNSEILLILHLVDSTRAVGRLHYLRSEQPAPCRVLKMNRHGFQVLHERWRRGLIPGLDKDRATK